MRHILSKYEVEIRLGLIVIVLLLMLLNISTSFLVYRVKRQLTDRIDQSITEAIDAAKFYVNRADDPVIPAGQKESFIDRFDLQALDVTAVTSYLTKSRPKTPYPVRPDLTLSEINRIREGELLFISDNQSSRRYGIGLARLRPGREFLVMAGTDARTLLAIAGAARQILWLTVIILIMIIPMTILMPRFILKPFRKMRKAAHRAGQDAEFTGTDEVADIINSYENVIRKLTQSEGELRRLYNASTSRADQLEKYNHYIMRSIGSGVVTVDLAGRVIGYNRAAKDILGYGERETINKHYLVAFPQEIELSLLMEAALERGEITRRRDVELIRSEGSHLWLGVESSLIYDNDDRIVGASLLFSDKTEIHKMQTELEMNRRMAALGEMTAGLAHQLRNSLAAVSGFSQLLSKKVSADSRLEEIAESIRTETVTSSLMVSRFLNFARPLRINPEAFNLLDLLNECREKYTLRNGEKEIQMTVESDTPEVGVIGDPMLLKEALGNLIDNSYQAVGEGGLVGIRIQALNERLHIVISDNGPGIPEDIIDKIFTPFFSSKPSGTGLGLALTQKIIQLHEGFISFDRGRSQGAVCRINLPLPKAALDSHTSELTAKKR